MDFSDVPDVDGRDAKDLLENVLRAEWKERREMREATIPFPTVRQSGGDSQDRAQNYAKGDVIYISSGGDEQFEPASVGFRDREVEKVLDLEIRTGQSRDRLFGVDDSEYSGLVGEIKYIIDGLRFGINEYDKVWYDSVSDQTADYGAGTWQAGISITFIAYSKPIGR